jgi:hypothetical protein
MPEAESPLALISSGMPAVKAARTLLSRLILPKSVSATIRSANKIWWIERLRDEFYLRGRFHLIPFIDGKPIESAQHDLLAWQLDIMRSERISWSNHRTDKANVTGSFSSLEFNYFESIVSIRVPSYVDKELEQCRAESCSRVFDIQQAERIVRRIVIDQNINTRKLVGNITLRDSLIYVRERFAREELVDVEGWSPFELAASVLTGREMTSLLPKATPAIESSVTLESRFHNFPPLDNDLKDSRCLSRLVHSDKFESNKTKHQRIVRLLAETLQSIGITPRYNRNIDLCVRVGDQELFFEVKTTDDTNFKKQVRCAVGQLLEYRHIYACNDKVRLVVVCEAVRSITQRRFVRAFLAGVGISLVLWDEASGVFEGLEGCLDNCLLARPALRILGPTTTSAIASRSAT